MDNNPKKNKPFVFVISGLDPSGKAGFLLDALVIHTLGGEVGGAISAITVQDFEKGYEYAEISTDITHQMVSRIIEQIPLDAVKIGMIPTIAGAETIYNDLKNLRVPIVWDPVLQTSDGMPLVEQGDIHNIFEALAQSVTVLTPNLPEAYILFDTDNEHLNNRFLHEMVNKYEFDGILLKGGHSQNHIVEDILVTPEKTFEYRRKRLNYNVRGTGCALSSALATALAKGLSLDDAFIAAEKFMDEFLIERAGFPCTL